MERPERMSSGEAMRWNEDVERRRREYHEQRCAEDAMYRKAYEYQQAEERRMWEQMHKPFAEILAAEAQQRCVADKTKDNHDVMVPISYAAHQMPENVEVQTVNDCMKDADKPQRIKTHVLSPLIRGGYKAGIKEKENIAAIEAYQRMSDAKKVAAGGNALAMGLIGMMFTCPDALQRRMKELEELKPYLDEIRETDERFRSEEIKLSGFEW
jgi:hypothetical protein